MEMTEKTKLRLIVVQAAILLETKGWTKGVLARAGDRETLDLQVATSFCAAGACMAASEGVLELDPGAHAALDEVKKTLGLQPYDYLSEWNDKPERTREEVIKALLDTAARLKGEGAE